MASRDGPGPPSRFSSAREMFQNRNPSCYHRTIAVSRAPAFVMDPGSLDFLYFKVFFYNTPNFRKSDDGKHSDHYFADKDSSDRISDTVSQMGHSPSIASTLAEGLHKARSEAFRRRFPGGAAARRLRAGQHRQDQVQRVSSRRSSSSPVSAIPTRRSIAITNGAWDYLEKPVSPEIIRLHIAQILEYKSEKGIKNTPPCPGEEGYHRQLETAG